MKRRFVSVLVVVALLFVAAGVFAADSPAFKNGGIEFQAGIGFGFWGYYTGASMTVPPIIASVEYQFMAAPQIPLSVGLLAGYTASQYKYDDGFGDTYTDTFSFIVVGGRVSYHFIELIKVPNLDTYAGLLLGYDIASVSYSGTGGFAGGSIPGSNRRRLHVRLLCWSPLLFRVFYRDLRGAWLHVGIRERRLGIEDLGFQSVCKKWPEEW